MTSLVPHKHNTGKGEKGFMKISAWMQWLLLGSWSVLLWGASDALGKPNETTANFGVEDYFLYKRVIELDVSPDGEMVVYRVQSQSLDTNNLIHEVFVQKTEANAKPEIVNALQDARDLEWLPGKNALAFLSIHNEKKQVYVFDLDTGKTSRQTDAEGKVTAFSFSPDGTGLAFTTEVTLDVDVNAASSKKMSLYEELRDGESGIVIDSNVVEYRHFIRPLPTDINKRNQKQLWLQSGHEEPSEVDLPGDAKGFHWSPDGAKLSVVYVDEEISQKSYYGIFTSLGVFVKETKQFKIVAEASEPETYSAQSGHYYIGGEWFPDGSSIHLRRIVRNTEKGRQSEAGEWTIIDPLLEEVDNTETKWRAIEHFHIDQVFPSSTGGMFLEKTVEGERALYRPERKKMVRANFLADLSGSAHKFAFSEDSKQAAFVSEDMVTPPEIFFWSEGEGITQLTSINETLSERVLPIAREVEWVSSDGEIVHGWLLEPPIKKEGPSPMLTFVHGGPAIPMQNEFAFYFYGFFERAGFWPYPFEAYAMNGVAVFLPNYRETKSYGVEFAFPKKRFDGEAIDDILSGVDHLIESGVADPTRLAISGHSHGAVLAPLAMTRSKRSFRAASFAEGAGNMIVLYDLMSANLNRYTHDLRLGHGKSLYDDPERYLNLSAAMHFRDLDTAMLFEAGAKSHALTMLGLPKSAQYHGLPTEFIVYPRTGHSISLPRLKLESASLNLDWFLFWLLDYENPSPDKAEQYLRWRKLRDLHRLN